MRSNLEDLMRQADPADLYEMPPVTGDRDDPLYASILSRRGITMAEEPTDQITSAEEGTRPARGWLVAAVAFVAVLVVGTVSLFWLTRSGGLEVVDEPTMTTVATTTTTPPPTTLAPSPLNLPDTWQRVGAAVMAPVVGIFDMTETSSGLVAVGFDPGEEDMRQNGAIFASPDGVTWTRLAEDDPALNLGDVLMYGVTDGGPGLVAVGSGVWTSIDGTIWNRSPADPDVFGGPGVMQDVVTTEHGLIAAGSLLTTDGQTELIVPTVWLSADGIEWERVWQGNAIDFYLATIHPHFHALTTSADGLVVGVGTATNDAGEFVAAVWTSADGRNWERIDRNSSAFTSDTDSDVSMQDVAWGPGGFVAVGTDGGTSVAIWHSPDGLTWTRADTADQPFENIGTLSTVDSLGTGWITAGPHGFYDRNGGTVTLWTSPDGLTWDRVHWFDPGYAMSVVATDSGIAVAGAMLGTDNFHAAVWAGPAFDPAAPPADPGPAPVPVAAETAPVPDEGLSCEELAETGFGYPETLSYWAFYGRPADLDPEGNGAPCETAFPVEAVEAVFGGPAALAVELVTDINSATFSATGPAVDAGIICATGVTEWSGRGEPDPNALGRWEDLYTCDDGSGTFILGTDIYFDNATHAYGVWNIVSGTGDHSALAGGGSTNSAFNSGIDLRTGRLWLTTEED